MNWWQQLFHYCERGADPAFWAEPFNALSNGAFIIAALVAAGQYRTQYAITSGGLPRDDQSAHDHPTLALIVLVFAIGVGSFLFHTFATRWASVADTAPIGIFMLSYIAFALRRFLGLQWAWIVLALITFVLSMRAMSFLPCSAELLPITAAAGRSCFNGSLGYVPAALSLVILTAAMMAIGHPAARVMAAAVSVFAVSLTFRTLDVEVCALTDVLGKARGTHALWHVANALLLYLLLRAALQSRPARLH